jgi:hypothetical protein
MEIITFFLLPIAGLGLVIYQLVQYDKERVRDKKS